MTDQPTTEPMIQRTIAAQTARDILRNMQSPTTADDIISLATWLLDEAPNPMFLVVSESGEVIREYPEEPTTEGLLTNKMIIEFTYDSPVSQDTVGAICAAHGEDEGLLRVRGTLVP